MFNRVKVFSLVTLLLAMAAVGVGCHSPSQYISPRVEGRVVNAITGQPISDVAIRRFSTASHDNDPPKGAEMLDSEPTVVTQADGSFIVKSRTSLAFLHHVRWYSVTFIFTRSGYEKQKRTYSFTEATKTPDGEPLVQAGEIKLNPISK